MAIIPPRSRDEILLRFDQSTSAAERGAAFTDFAEFMLVRIPGVSLGHRDQLDVQRAQEIDLGLFNNRSPKGFHFLPHVLLAECKGWSVPVGAPEVREFATKLRERKRTMGFLISAHGITGDPVSLTAANDAVAGALRDGIELVVLTREELAEISDTKHLVDLTKRKLCSLAVTRVIV